MDPLGMKAWNEAARSMGNVRLGCGGTIVFWIVVLIVYGVSKARELVVGSSDEPPPGSSHPLIAPPSSPPTADAPGKWGAIAYNDANGRWGVAWDKEGQIQADHVSIKRCGAGCTVRVRFGTGRCGAFARGHGTAWGKGLGADRAEAEANAVASCSAVARGCVAKVSGCNAR